MKSLDEGGRPADVARNYLIYQLAEAAPEIIGKPATVATTGRFVDLVYRGSGGMWPAGNRHRQGYSPCGEEAARKSGEVAQGTRIHDCRRFRSRNLIRFSRASGIGLRRGMRSVRWHGRITSTPKALAKPACEPGPGQSNDAGAATSSDTVAFAGGLPPL